MSGVIIFLSSGLFVYWLSRTFTLLYGSDTEIDEMLAHDLWLCHKIVLLVRSAFPPPTLSAPPRDCTAPVGLKVHR